MLDKGVIKKSYINISHNINNRANLLAVSKYQSVDKIKYLASLGQMDFGENYFQELEQKALELPELHWHFIGSLQSRKIKYIVKYVDSIQSVEKFEHVEKINKAATQLNKEVTIFLQINIDDDPNKSGLKSSQLEEGLSIINKSNDFKCIKIVGLMCIPAKSITPENSFEKMRAFFNQLNSKLPPGKELKRLSMGMSADYRLAIKYGSTDVRVGSSLFGNRHR